MHVNLITLSDLDRTHRIGQKKALSNKPRARNNIDNNGFIFLHETHLSSNDEQKWKDDFRGPLFFSHQKSKFCCVAISYFGTEAFKVAITACDKNG